MLINCDMGEQLSPDSDKETNSNPDASAMPFLDLANIACGGHAGDNHSMASTVALAQQHQVKIGAHPSYPDQGNFGRKVMSLSWAELEKSLSEQLNQLQQYAPKLHHVKPHGALYLEMMRHPELFERLLTWHRNTAPQAYFVMQAHVNQTPYLNLAKKYKVSVLLEAFADRAYLPNGQLMPRSQKNSLYQTPEEIQQQSHDFIQQGFADTLCFHSDNPASLTALTQI